MVRSLTFLLLILLAGSQVATAQTLSVYHAPQYQSPWYAMPQPGNYPGQIPVMVPGGYPIPGTVCLTPPSSRGYGCVHYGPGETPFRPVDARTSLLPPVSQAWPPGQPIHSDPITGQWAPLPTVLRQVDWHDGRGFRWSRMPATAYELQYRVYGQSQ